MCLRQETTVATLGEHGIRADCFTHAHFLRCLRISTSPVILSLQGIVRSNSSRCSLLRLHQFDPIHNWFHGIRLGYLPKSTHWFSHTFIRLVIDAEILHSQLLVFLHDWHRGCYWRWLDVSFQVLDQNFIALLWVYWLNVLNDVTVSRDDQTRFLLGFWDAGGCSGGLLVMIDFTTQFLHIGIYEFRCGAQFVLYSTLLHGCWLELPGLEASFRIMCARERWDWGHLRLAWMNHYIAD